MNTVSKTTKIESKIENKPRVTATALLRLAGFAAVLAGLGMVVMGAFHPVNEPASVTTPAWIVVHIIAASLGFFGVTGLAGLYARQAEKAGWLGLIGFLLFSLWMALVGMFSFIEAALLPLLASEYPPFVAGVMDMFRGVPSQVNLGALPTLWNLSTPMLILGSLLFAVATFRAAVLPRWAAVLLALGTVMIPVGGLLPLKLQAAIILGPMGLGLAWMGAALLAGRHEKLAVALLDQPAAGMKAKNAA